VQHAILGLWRSRSSDYFDFKFDCAHSAAALDCYPHDYVLMTSASPVRELVARRPDWKLVYRDLRVLLFARADSAAAHLDRVRYRIACTRGCFPKAHAREIRVAFRVARPRCWYDRPCSHGGRIARTRQRGPVAGGREQMAY
jgi:hypothetical protein